MSRSQRCGFVSLLYSVGEKPLSLWSKHISLDGRIRRVEDQALRGDKVIEIMGPHQTPLPTNITCPANPLDILNIKLPILVFVVKNLELVFKIEFQLLDKMMHRRQFSLTTHNPEKPPLAHANAVQVPLKLDYGWNNLEINLQTLCNEVFGSDYQAVQRIIIYPNCRIRRVYFQDRHYEQDETPVELCQAFFDMYMLKWGIHLVERSCQTEEIYTGPLQSCDLEYFATESNMSVSVTTTNMHLYEDMRIKHIKQDIGKNIGVSMTLCNGKTVVLKNNSKSLNQFGKEIEIISNSESKLLNSERSPSIATYDVQNLNITDEKKCKSANSCEKYRKRSEHKSKKGKKEARVKNKLGVDREKLSLNFKKIIETAKLAPHIKKSQYLKSQIGENFLSSNSTKEVRHSLEYLYDCNEKSKSNLKVDCKEQCKVIGKLNLKDNVDSNYFGPSIATTNQEDVAMTKNEVVHNSKARIDGSTKKLKPDSNSSNNLRKVETYQGDSLPNHNARALEEVIDEVQKIREQLINYDIDRRMSSGVTRDTPKDLVYHVPTVVDIQATPSNEKSKKAALSTEKAVCDFLELRYAVNKKILEKLKDKGLTITEVELSIYNSKNRRNCYGQGKLIESGNGGTNKATGLSSVRPVQLDISLKKEHLSLNDKICIELRNELDAALLQLKSTQVRVLTEAVEDTIGNMVNTDSQKSNSNFFTIQEAQCIKKQVYNESVTKRDMAKGSDIRCVDNGRNQIEDFIQDLDKYSGKDVIDTLYIRQMYDAGA